MGRRSDTRHAYTHQIYKHSTMKLVGLTVATLAAVALANKEQFAANKEAERQRILDLKQQAWEVKEAQRQAKDDENASVRQEKDEAKANSWAQKEAVRDAKDAAKANSWEIRQVIRDRKDAMKAVVDLNRATAKAAQAAVRAAFWEKRADERVNWNVRTAGLRAMDMYCYNTDDVSATWTESDNGITIDGWQNIHQGSVAIGRSAVQSGNYFISLVGGFGDKRVYAVEGEGSMESTRSPYGKYQDLYWTISGTDVLEPSNDVLNVNVAHAGNSAGSELTWYLCVDRNDASNPCRDEPCQNAGTCSVGDGNANCECLQEPVAFEGPTCETCTCENSTDMSSCVAFLGIMGIDQSTVQGCDYLEHCLADDVCTRFDNKCAAMQSNCGSGEIQAFVPCILL